MAAGRGLQAGFAGAFPNSLSSLLSLAGAAVKPFAGSSLRASAAAEKFWVVFPLFLAQHG